MPELLRSITGTQHAGKVLLQRPCQLRHLLNTQDAGTLLPYGLDDYRSGSAEIFRQHALIGAIEFRQCLFEFKF